MTCPRCQRENPATVKFCGECGARLDVACSACRAPNPGANKFCHECGAPMGPKPAAGPLASPESYTPKHLAEKILTSKAALEGERKQVTVLFADLKGSMELLADRDPEQARKILDPVLEHMMEAVHRYEGTVNQVMGDGIMALFGAPLAHEDHAVRACYAALRMQESVRRYADGLRRDEGVSILILGVNSGDVVVRAIGSDLRMDYTAVGQTTHLAARMEQLATPGSILMTADTLRLAEGSVEVKPLGPVNVKGLGGPVDVFEMTGAGPVRTRLQASAARGLTRFVGRDPELEQLRQAQEQTGSGRGQVVAVVGEPGVGKSRLLYEFVRSHRAQGWRVLQSASVSYGKATSYLPVIELLRDFFGIEARDDTRAVQAKVTGIVLTLDRALEDAIVPLLALLDALPADDALLALEPAHRRQLTLAAIKRVLLRESQVQPLVVIFEDLHWIDTETQAGLDLLVESLPSARVLLCVNYRPEYQHAWGSKTYYRQLRIDPLARASAAELLGALLGDDFTLHRLAQVLIERTDGNPFFLEESVRALVETEALVGEPGHRRLTRAIETVQIPASVQAILAARIDRLDPEDKQLLQTAAVIGTEVPLTLLQAVADRPEEALRSSLGRLQGAEFLYESSLFPDVQYTFKHALTHEVTYASLLGPRRRDLHARIVSVTERLAPARLEEEVERLAHHAYRGEVWEQAVDYLHRAARKAASRSAHREAVVACERALEALRNLSESRETLSRGVDLRRQLDFELFLLGEIPRALEVLEEAERGARALGDRPRLGEILDRLGDRLANLNQRERGIACLRQALAIAGEVHDSGLEIFTRFHLGLVYFSMGDFSGAGALFRENVTVLKGDLLLERFGRATLPGILCRSWLARSLAETGQFPEASEMAQEALRLCADVGHPFSEAQAWHALGVTFVLRGAAEESIAPLERGLAIAELRELQVLIPLLLSQLALAYALSGRTADSLALVEQPRADPDQGPTFWLRQARQFIMLGEVRLLAGHPVEASRLAERALALAREGRQRGAEAAALRQLGDIASQPGSLDERAAEDHYGQAIAIATECGMRPLVAHCHVGLGKLCRRTGGREQAHEHLTTAMTMYREMDMRFWLEQAEAEMRELV